MPVPFSMFFVIMIMMMLFSGCKTTETVYKTDVEYIVIKPSSALLEECPPLESKEIKTNGDLANAYTGLMFDYIVCSNRMRMIKDFFSEYNKDKNNTISITTDSEKK